MIYFIANYIHAVRELGFYDASTSTITINALQPRQDAGTKQSFANFFENTDNLINPLFNAYMASAAAAAAAPTPTTTTCKTYLAENGSSDDYSDPCVYLFDTFYNTIYSYGCVSLNDFPYTHVVDIPPVSATFVPCEISNKNTRIDPFLVGAYTVLYVDDEYPCRIQITSSTPPHYANRRFESVIGQGGAVSGSFTQERYLPVIKRYLNSGIPLDWAVANTGLGKDSSVKFSTNEDHKTDPIYTFSSSSSSSSSSTGARHYFTVVGYVDADISDASKGCLRVVNTESSPTQFVYLSYTTFFKTAHTFHLIAFT